MLNFDLADAKSSPRRRTSPRSSRRPTSTQTSVEIALIGDSDVHSFRDDKNYVVDVAFQPDKGKTAATPEAAIAQAEAGGQRTGAGRWKAGGRRSPKDAHGEITPPTSETIAREAKIDGQARELSSRKRPPRCRPPKRRSRRRLPATEAAHAPEAPKPTPPARKPAGRCRKPC